MKDQATPIVYERRDKVRLRKMAPVYVEASTQTLAHVSAINLYRMMQIPVRFVSVREYNPSQDADLPCMAFVRPITAPSNVRPKEDGRNPVITSAHASFKFRVLAPEMP
jgi:hypothetical protein